MSVLPSLRKPDKSLVNQGGGRQRAANVGLTFGQSPLLRKPSGGLEHVKLYASGWILTTDTCEVGKQEKGKERTSAVVVSVCLPTNTLSSSLPPSLAPPLDLVHHKLRATRFPPSLQCSSISFLFGTNDCDCGLLFQKAALRCNRYPVTATASGLAATADLRYSCRKGGLADRLFGRETRLSRDLRRQ